MVAGLHPIHVASDFEESPALVHQYSAPSAVTSTNIVRARFRATMIVKCPQIIVSRQAMQDKDLGPATDSMDFYLVILDAQQDLESQEDEDMLHTVMIVI
jgi:hypothetical protein